MTRNGRTTAIYIQHHISREIDLIIDENKELYHSKSQLINSLLFKFMREQGKIPAEMIEKLL